MAAGRGRCAGAHVLGQPSRHHGLISLGSHAASASRRAIPGPPGRRARADRNRRTPQQGVTLSRSVLRIAGDGHVEGGGGSTVGADEQLAGVTTGAGSRTMRLPDGSGRGTWRSCQRTTTERSHMSTTRGMGRCSSRSTRTTPVRHARSAAPSMRRRARAKRDSGAGRVVGQRRRQRRRQRRPCDPRPAH